MVRQKRLSYTPSSSIKDTELRSLSKKNFSHRRIWRKKSTFPWFCKEKGGRPGWGELVLPKFALKKSEPCLAWVEPGKKVHTCSATLPVVVDRPVWRLANCRISGGWEGVTRCWSECLMCWGLVFAIDWLSWWLGLPTIWFSLCPGKV